MLGAGISIRVHGVASQSHEVVGLGISSWMWHDPEPLIAVQGLGSVALGLKMGGSLVGVWSGWRYGHTFFAGSEISNSDPEIWQKSAFFFAEFEGFPYKF